MNVMQKMQEVKRTSITVKPYIRDGIKHAARKDQSYNEILEEMLDVYKRHRYDHIFFEENETISNLAPRVQSKDQIASSTVLVEGGPL